MGKHTRRLGILVISLFSLGVIGTATPAGAGHDDDPRSDNMHPMGHIEEPRSATAFFLGETGEIAQFHTDIAFWGKTAFQGNWLGFSVRDIRAPGNPRPISFTECTGGQGDVVIWDNILVRSWDSGAAPGSGAPPGATCAGEDVPVDFAGLHVFDVSDLTAPELVGSVDLGPSADPASCGSHTATGVPDLENNRLIVYGGPSTFDCPWIDVVEIPLDAPEDAAFIRQVPAGRPCHDNSAILGDAMLLACAGGDGFTMLSLANSLEDPEVLYSKNINEEDIDGEVTIGHSSAFSFDGEVLVFGHEPGGGIGARCTEDEPASNKSALFFDVESGDLLGEWTLPRPQTENENCTFHNFNVVPLPSGRDVFVHGSYQAGTGVVDFTDPENPVELAWSDPPPIPLPDPAIFCQPAGCELGGAWSSYWYNNFIYETNIGEGLNLFRFSGPEAAGALRLDHLNPQTQEFTLP
jgi:hypothetical protein